jgi:hypothetical protein
VSEERAEAFGEHVRQFVACDAAGDKKNGLTREIPTADSQCHGGTLDRNLGEQLSAYLEADISE